MIKLLIIADDFTGALDTGAQFTKLGVEAHVVISTVYDFPAVKPSVQVLVMDAETRHLSSDVAGKIVAEITARAIAAGVKTIYKKTDSALRGNIGSELSAQLAASGQNVLYYIPAYPKAGRTTCNGVHYVDGVPVAQSVFGKDPFEPVRFSSVAQLIASQSSIRVQTIHIGEFPPEHVSEKEKTIFVFDVKTDEDLGVVAQLIRSRKVGMLAGCAGLAEFLPQALEMTSHFCQKLVQANGLMVISGSLNPITVKQIRTAREAGFRCVTLTHQQKTDIHYVHSAEFDVFLQEITSIYQKKKKLIIESLDSSFGDSETGYIQPDGYISEDARRLVAGNISTIVKKMLERGIGGVYVLIGGDTLLAVISKLQCKEIIPLGEMATGVVLSRVEFGTQDHLYVVSKSGGLGEGDILMRIAQMLLSEEEVTIW